MGVKIGSMAASRPRRGPRAAGLFVALVMSLATGCSFQGLNFVQDDRVSILSPTDRQEVDLPVTLRWDVRDFDGTFAVFVDRAPVPPGHTLDWLARDDDLCRARPGCPDEAWYHARYVYPTDATTLTLTELPELRADEGRLFHEATVVLIDRAGRRVGESAFTVQFELRRER